MRLLRDSVEENDGIDRRGTQITYRVSSLGVTRQTIIAMEQGKYAPSLELAFRIALVFDVSLEKVFAYELVEDTQ